MSHIETHHAQTNLHMCYNCDLTFCSHYLLKDHIATSHHKKNLHCSYCDNIFEDMTNLNTHTKSYHSTLTYKVPSSDHLPKPGRLLLRSFQSEQIPQLDGNFSPTSLCAIPTHSEEDPTSNSMPSYISNTKHAPYALNRQKQLSRLQKDTLLGNYTITVSPSNQNVNIQCSTGFYTQVALPSLSDIKVGNRFEVPCDFGNVSVYCYDITGEIDNSNANIKAVIFFRLSNIKKQGKGGVTVHLHHTKRKLQFQGGALMPDKTKAPVWFVKNVRNTRFSNLAMAKSLDISKFNKSIREMLSNIVKKQQAPCGVCKNHFIGRSQPELCLQCNRSFHKKCLMSDDHICVRTPHVSVAGLPAGSNYQNADQPPHRPALPSISTPTLPLFCKQYLSPCS